MVLVLRLSHACYIVLLGFLTPYKDVVVRNEASLCLQSTGEQINSSIVNIFASTYNPFADTGMPAGIWFPGSFLPWCNLQLLARSRRGSWSIPVRGRDFSLLQFPDRLWVPPSLLSIGYCGCFSRVKRPEREAVSHPCHECELYLH